MKISIPESVSVSMLVLLVQMCQTELHILILKFSIEDTLIVKLLTEIL